MEFPKDLSSFAIYFLIFSSMFTSFVTAAFGIGGGAISLGFLAIYLNPIYLLPVHGAVQIGSNFGRTLLMVKDVQKEPIIPFLIGSCMGSLLGGVLFIQFPSSLIQLLVATFILWTVFGKMPAIKLQYIVFGGMFSSFLTMFFGATGPFISAMVKTIKLDPLKHIATHSSLMTIQHIIKVIVFGLLGFSFAEYFNLILIMILSGLLGTYIGKKVLVNFGKKYFKVVLNTILTLISINLIINSLMTWLI